MEGIFDSWPEKYDQWFKTPIGRLVEEYESDLILEMLGPAPGDQILDVGCGTGTFTRYLLSAGSEVVGLEISPPMLLKAKESLAAHPFQVVRGDMLQLPFPDNRFDKVASITAIEFVENARTAVLEAFRVTKPGGCIVIATLNSLSPWASRRKAAAEEGHPLFKHAIFRSPDQMRGLAPVKGTAKTAIHFERNETPSSAKKIEKSGRSQDLPTGAFLAVKWMK